MSDEQTNDQSIETLRAQIDALTAKLENTERSVQSVASAQATPKEEKKQEYTEVSAEEIRAALDSGTITESQADQIRESQIQRRLEKRLEENLDSKAKSNAISAEIMRYQEAFPELTNITSATFKRVAKEFNDLVALGMDKNDPKTELVAARAALGPAARIARNDHRPAHQEVGGGLGGESAADEDGNIPAWVKGDLKSFYQKQINNGYYSGWDDPVVVTELTEYAGRLKAKMEAA